MRAQGVLLEAYWRNNVQPRVCSTLIHAINSSLIHWCDPWSSFELTEPPNMQMWISLCLRGGEGKHNH